MKMGELFQQYLQLLLFDAYVLLVLRYLIYLLFELQVAMAMAAKAKLLLRELKTVKADLAFAKERCAQLEEETKILRENRERGESPEDDDLVSTFAFPFSFSNSCLRPLKMRIWFTVFFFSLPFMLFIYYL